MREPLAKLGGGGEQGGGGSVPGKVAAAPGSLPSRSFPPPTSRIKRVPSPGAASDPRV